MIHKLLKIENVGTFVKVEFNTPNQNGEFKKYNAIYADNGCGKTTFTQRIFIIILVLINKHKHIGVLMLRKMEQVQLLTSRLA